MVSFEIQDMRCGHCVSSITQAVRMIDPGAQVTADLASRQVRIGSTMSDPVQLRDAIRAAGYTPVPIANADAEAAAGPGAPRSACGCC